MRSHGHYELFSGQHAGVRVHHMGSNVHHMGSNCHQFILPNICLLATVYSKRVIMYGFLAIAYIMYRFLAIVYSLMVIMYRFLAIVYNLMVIIYGFLAIVYSQMIILLDQLDFLLGFLANMVSWPHLKASLL